MSTTDTPALSLEGHCYCANLRYRVNLPANHVPVFTAYCHCDSCRRAHAAPLYRVIGLDAAHFEITQGAELLTEFSKPANTITRCFCSRCGSKILNRFPGWNPKGITPIVIFPDTLVEGAQTELPENMRPTRNNRSEECVIDWERLRMGFPNE
jgi:hypothetical protein